MRLLWFNPATDANDPILGFTTRWIEAVAKRVDFIYVITMKAGCYALPPNVRVYSIGKEKGYSKPRRAIEFYRYLFQVLRRDHIDVCFSHMMPIFTIMAAPVLKIFRVPIVTWYAHRKRSRVLKIAHHLSVKMATINESSYPYRHDKKLICIGHGIDTDLFTPADDTVSNRAILILSVGRLSPIKDLLTLLRAVDLLRQQGFEIRCALVGEVPKRDQSYASRLHQYVREAGLEKIVRFEGAVPYHKVTQWYKICFLHVNCGPPDHSLDKSVLEAMACGKPSLTSILGFKETMGKWADLLIFKYRDPEDLARKIKAIWRMPSAEREKMGAELRKSVVEHHSLERLADKLVELFKEILIKC